MYSQNLYRPELSLTLLDSYISSTVYKPFLQKSTPLAVKWAVGCILDEVYQPNYVKYACKPKSFLCNLIEFPMTKTTQNSISRALRAF